MATLHELQSVYTLEDAYQMDEALTIKCYHEWLASKPDKPLKSMGRK